MGSRALVLLGTLLFAALASSHAFTDEGRLLGAEPAQATEGEPSPIPRPTSTPGPSPTPRANICESPLSTTPGGTPIQFGLFEIVLPAGYSYVWVRTGSGDSVGAAICVPALNSSIFIGDDGQEVFRSVNNPAAAGLFAQILAGVHLQSCGVALPHVSGPAQTHFGLSNFDLPSGTFVLSLGIADPGGSGWTTVCYVEGNSEIRIGNDCKEISRRVLKPEANAILDQVRSNARCSPPPSSPTPVPPSGLSLSGSVLPPGTGDAGLK